MRLAGATVRHTERRNPDVLILHTDRGAFHITAWAYSDALAEQDEEGIEVGLSIKHVPGGTGEV